jgi:hypothetical protein
MRRVKLRVRHAMLHAPPTKARLESRLKLAE